MSAGLAVESARIEEEFVWSSSHCLSSEVTRTQAALVMLSMPMKRSMPDDVWCVFQEWQEWTSMQERVLQQIP